MDLTGMMIGGVTTLVLAICPSTSTVRSWSRPAWSWVRQSL